MNEIRDPAVKIGRVRQCIVLLGGGESVEMRERERERERQRKRKKEKERERERDAYKSLMVHMPDTMSLATVSARA